MLILTQKSKKLITYNDSMFFSIEKNTKTKYCIMCHDVKTGYIHRIAINLPLYVAQYLMVRILVFITRTNNTIIDIDDEIKGAL